MVYPHDSIALRFDSMAWPAKVGMHHQCIIYPCHTFVSHWKDRQVVGYYSGGQVCRQVLQVSDLNITNAGSKCISWSGLRQVNHLNISDLIPCS